MDEWKHILMSCHASFCDIFEPFANGIDIVLLKSQHIFDGLCD